MNLRPFSRRPAVPTDPFAGRTADVIGSWTPAELARLTGRLQAAGLTCTQVSQGEGHRVVLRVSLTGTADREQVDALVTAAGGRILALPH